MKRFTALYNILEFGKIEEHKLIMANKKADAYQIEHARKQLIYFFDKNPIKNLVRKIDSMITYTIDEQGVWHYDTMNFVNDELTRQLLSELRKVFGK